MPTVQIRNGGGAPMGAAMVAAVGIGAFASLPEVSAKWVAVGQRFDSDETRADYNEDHVARYEALLEALHLWSAPTRRRFHFARNAPSAAAPPLIQSGDRSPHSI